MTLRARTSCEQMQQVAPLFDDFVGSREQCSRHFEAERFGGLDVEHGFVFRRSLHREVGWFLAFQDAVDVGGGKPIQRGLINPEGDQSAFGDETAEVMGSNGAMIVPQDIKPKQTVRQDFRQCLIIAPRSSTCRVQLHWRLGQGADDGRMARVAEAWDRSTAPGATSRSTISSASVRLQHLRLACRSGARLIPILATRHGRARPGHACLWTDILNPL
jgi:hypothetical protein